MNHFTRFLRVYGAMSLVAMALVLVLGLAEAIQDIEMMSLFPGSLPVRDVFLHQFSKTLFWLVMAPAVAFFGQRVRPGALSLPRTALAHVTVGILIVGAAALLQNQLPPTAIISRGIAELSLESLNQLPEVRIRATEELPPEIAEILQATEPGFPSTGTWVVSSAPLLSGFLKYALLVMFVMALQLHRDVRDRQAQTERLQNQLALAQLSTLRMQLRPHFLFNTLNSISTLMPRDVDGARRMVGQLADLLRASFSEKPTHETTLQDEMEMLQCYLSIQQTRFGEGLQTCFDVAPDVIRALVPSFCLQPLVENAVVHGLSKRAELGTVTVKANRRGADLNIEVSDDGAGACDDQTTDEGIGLRNTRERMAQLYGSQAGIEIEAPTTGGFVVRLRIPYHEKPIDTREG